MHIQLYCEECGVSVSIEISNIHEMLRSADRYKTSQTILGSTITNWLLKKTFFAHFCAGENERDIAPTMQKLREAGVGGNPLSSPWAVEGKYIRFTQLYSIQVGIRFAERVLKPTRISLQSSHVDIVRFSHADIVIVSSLQ